MADSIGLSVQPTCYLCAAIAGSRYSIGKTSLGDPTPLPTCDPCWEGKQGRYEAWRALHGRKPRWDCHRKKVV